MSQASWHGSYLIITFFYCLLNNPPLPSQTVEALCWRTGRKRLIKCHSAVLQRLPTSKMTTLYFVFSLRWVRYLISPFNPPPAKKRERETASAALLKSVSTLTSKKGDDQQKNSFKCHNQIRNTLMQWHYRVSVIWYVLGPWIIQNPPLTFFNVSR